HQHCNGLCVLMGFNRANIRSAVAALCVLASPNGWAELAVVVSGDTPVESMPASQLESVFLGRSSYLPGELRAVPLDQAEGRDIREAFYRDILGRSPAQIKAHWSKI